MFALLNALKEDANSVFAFREKETKSYGENIFKNSDHIACFKAKRKSLFESNIFMLIDSGVLTVTNIVSPSNPVMSVGEYNLVLTTFYEGFIAPRLDDRYRAEITNGEKEMRDVLDAETLDKLESWEGGCNKETPISHPADCERWMDFVISAYRHESELSHDDFMQWLREDKGWPEMLEEKIEDLSYLYEYGKKILRRAYNEN